jgi:predicted transcriptional regulator
MSARQNYAIPKQRCEVRLPADLDVRLDRLSEKAGVTRTALVVAAIERFVYAEETQAGVETLHERVAVLSVALEEVLTDLAEVRAYLDALARTVCGGDPGKFGRFLRLVEKAKSELEEAG